MNFCEDIVWIRDIKAFGTVEDLGKNRKRFCLFDKKKQKLDQCFVLQEGSDGLFVLQKDSMLQGD